MDFFSDFFKLFDKGDVSASTCSAKVFSAMDIYARIGESRPSTLLVALSKMKRIYNLQNK